MSESTMRSAVIKKLVSIGAYSVENATYPGYPDVECPLGVIELKIAEDWPKRMATPVRFKHFTPQQRAYLMKRWRKSQDAWMLVKVKRTWFLFNGETAALHVGKIDKNSMYARCDVYWDRFLYEEELINFMLQYKLRHLNAI